jgi:hypothetical protein
MKHILSKSTFLRGWQCPKSLYLHKFFPKLKGEISAQQQAIFNRGTTVGELAQQLFPGGTDASPATPFLYQQSVEFTKKLIESGTKVIYEAAFQYEGVLAAIDVLVNEKGKWKGFEVKSSTEIKEVNILDASLQYYVIKNSGLELKDISIVHINNQYIRTDKLDLKKFFIKESIYEDVLNNQELIAEKIDELKLLLKQKNVPEIDIGPHCTDPYPCDFMEHCWSHIPENSIFDIANLRTEKKFNFYSQGIIRYDDIEQLDLLNEKQQQQVELFIKKKDHIDKKGIKEFLKTISYPLFFLDFETFNPAVPLYKNSKPYQQIPFQYSLHYLENEKSKLKHFEFLAVPGNDPRIPFIEKLLRDTSAPGDIITYNQSFEKGRLQELSDYFPEFSKELQSRIVRIKDLMLPFRERILYKHTMHGSYSIKEVLPALVPEFSYDDLLINNGGDASIAFERMVLEPEKDYTELRNQLLEYCGMDTLAMVKILEVLNRSI